MIETEENNDLQKQLDEKILRLANFKKAIPKMIIAIIAAMFLAPFLPNRRMVNLVTEKGYWGTIFFGAPILIIVAAIVVYFQFEKIKEEIEILQKKVKKY